MKQVVLSNGLGRVSNPGFLLRHTISNSRRKKSKLGSSEHYKGLERSVSAVCERCNKILSKNGQIKHYPTLGGIANSAVQGCHLCILLWNKLRVWYDVENPDEAGIDIHIYQRDEDSLRMTLSHKTLPLDYHFKLLSAIKLHHLVNWMPVSSSTSSDTSLQLAKDWIQECTTNHMACRSNRTTKFMPTRLIDLDGDLFQPRLVDSRNMLEQAAFNTLSHCWGPQSDQRLELRASNISSMKISIPLSQLPVTFYQAMRLCKELGVRYLWIDALCIIQDSEEDWVRESAVMADIYQNAFCNTVAYKIGFPSALARKFEAPPKDGAKQSIM